MEVIDRLVGVYHADGGLRGEASYVLGKLLGSAHCSLCDITHSPWRRKPAWDAMAARLGVPFHLVHRDEWPRTVPTPLVLGFSGQQELQLLGPDDLEELGGSVAAFEAALRAAVIAGGFRLASASAG